MSLKKTLFLAVILFGLLAYVFRFEMPRIASEKMKDRPFGLMAKSAVSKIEFSNKGEAYSLSNNRPQWLPSDKDRDVREKDFSLDNADSADWTLSGVPGAQVDQGALNSLLSSVISLSSGQALPKDEVGSDLSPFGLSAPTLSLKIEMLKKGAEATDAAARTNTQIFFGKKNEYLSQYYLRLLPDSDEKSAQIFLVNEAFFTACDKKKNDFRKKTPISIKDADLKRIVINSVESKEDLVLARSADASASSEWQLVSPESARASSESVAALLRTLNNLRAKEFFDGDAAKLEAFGLNQPTYNVSLEFKDELNKPALKFSFASISNENAKDDKAKTNLYFMQADVPSVYAAESDPSKDIVKSALAFREKKFLKFNSVKVKQLESSAEGQSDIKIVADNGQYKVNGKAADSSFVRELLNSLSGLEAVGFPSQSVDFGFSKPRLKIVVNLDSSSQLAGAGKNEEPKALTLVVGSAAENDNDGQPKSYYAAVGDFSEPFIISKESFKKISPQEEILVAKTP